MATLKSIKNKYLTSSDGTVLGVTTNTENLATLSFKMATALSLSKFNMKDGFADDFNDNTGVDTSGSTDELRNSDDNFYSGGVSGAGSGGIETSYAADGNTYKIHSFLTTSTFTISGGTGNVDLFVVGAGGGAGGNDGNNAAGGGGGGGMREISDRSMTEAVFDVTVGAASTGDGGDSSVAYSSGAGSGFATISGTGGGSGGGSAEGGAGGSGGGWGGYDQNGPGGNPAGNEGGYSPVEGYDGGRGSGGGGSPPCASRNGGGGGGAGGVGSRAPDRSGNSSGPGGAGGVGRQNSWRTGSNVYYAGGGGGGGTSGAGSGGTGGGATGGSGYGAPGGTGTTNLGGGAGGGSHGTSASTSGSGIVVLRYIEGVFVAYNDMTLQSNAFTAQTQPDTARLVLDEWAYNGTQVLDTDLKAYCSRDGGTTYTQATLTSQGYLLGAGGINGNTQLMLHCEGANNGTTFTDDCTEGGNNAKVWTASGNAVTSTTQFKFGTASAYFDGTGDYISTLATTDWDFGSGDFTIDFWMRPGAVDSQQRIFGNLNSGGSSSQFEFIVGGSNTMSFGGSLPSSLAVTQTTTTIAINTWYHIAITRSGTDWRLFVNGTAGSTASFSGTMGANTTTSIGRSGAFDSQYYTGYIDEVKITKGVALWTSNFTVPDQPYRTSRRLVSGSADISGQPAGTTMKYKLTTHNQSVSKVTRVYGACMQWA